MRNRKSPLRKALWAALVFLLLAGYFYRPVIPENADMLVGLTIVELPESSHGSSLDLTAEQAKQVQKLINRAFLFPLPRNSLGESPAYMLMFSVPGEEDHPDIIYVSYDGEIEWRHRCYRLPASTEESLKTLIWEEAFERMAFTVGQSSDRISYSIVVGPDLVKQDTEAEALPGTETADNSLSADTAYELARLVEDEERSQPKTAYVDSTEALDRAYNRYYDDYGASEETEATAQAGGEEDGENTASR